MTDDQESSEMYRWFDSEGAALDCITAQLTDEGWERISLSHGHKFLPPRESNRRSAIFVEILHSTTRDEYRYAQRLVPFIEEERPKRSTST